MNTMRFLGCVGLLFACCAPLLLAAQHGRVLIHAHNDYEQPMPFYQAYGQQAYTIEADVFATEDGRLLVGHDLEDLQPDRTLESLYIKPIADVFASNGGRAWTASDSRFVLLIDLKTPAASTLSPIVDLIAKHPDVFDEAINPYAVTVVISGDMPPPASFDDFPRFIQFDGRLNTGYTSRQLERVAFISAPFSSYASWNGKGALIGKEKKQVADAIEKAHGMGKKIRFWGTPDGPTAWDTLHKMGVDIINTDQIERCTEFFSGFDIRQTHGQADRRFGDFRLIAHRGGIVDENTAENSLQALEKAILRGYCRVEIDVRMSKDSVFVVHHDRTFLRYYGIDTPVTEMTLPAIRRLKGDRDNRVHRLEEILSKASGRIGVMIDLKIPGNDTVLHGRLLQMLATYDLLADAMMIGTDESTDFYRGKISLSCTRQQLEANRKRSDFNASHYYLFSNDISADDVRWASGHGIAVVGAVNAWRQQGDVLGKGATSIKNLSDAGVRTFQIDSMFDVFFLDEVK